MISENFFLQDLFIESGIVSEGSVKCVLTGENYNRSVSCHKILYESLQRLRFQAFLDDLEEEKEGRIMEFLCEMSDSFPEKNFRDRVESQVFEEICDEYENFILDASVKSRTFSFWSMYIKMMGKYTF